MCPGIVGHKKRVSDQSLTPRGGKGKPGSTGGYASLFPGLVSASHPRIRLRRRSRHHTDLGRRTGGSPAPNSDGEPALHPSRPPNGHRTGSRRRAGVLASSPAPAPSLTRPAVSVPVSPPVSVPVTMAPLALPGPRRPRELPIPMAPGVGPVPPEPVAPAPSGLRTSPPEPLVPVAPELPVPVAPEPLVSVTPELPISVAPEPLVSVTPELPISVAPGSRPLVALAARTAPPEPEVAVAFPPRVPSPGRPGPVPPAVRISRPPEAPVPLALDARPRALGRPSPVAPVLGRPAPGMLRRRVRGTLGTPARGSLVSRLRVLDRAESGDPYEYGHDPGPHDAHLGTPPPSDHSGGCLLLYNSLPGSPGRLTISDGRRRGRDLPVRRAPRSIRGAPRPARGPDGTARSGGAVRRDGSSTGSRRR